MGRRGPAPKPTALKVLSGTRKDRINRNEPKPPEGAPPRPKWLDPVAVQEWLRIVPELLELGVLTKIDGQALGLYCAAFSEMVHAEGAIAEHGLVVTTGNAEYRTVKANPAVAIRARAQDRCYRYLQEFGCTPAARSRLTLKAEEKPSALREFLERRRQPG